MGVFRSKIDRGTSPWAGGAALALTGALAASLSCVASAPPPSAPAPAVVEAAEPAAPTVAEPVSAREIARRASGYTVFVRSGAAYGAGVLFDGQGHVLTCNHVLLDPESVEVRFEGASSGITARVVERDPDLDLALLAIDGEVPASSRPATAYGFDGLEAIERGDEVYAMGSPRKMRFSFHRGIVSFIGRPFEQVFFLQTDLAMNPGSSGGPILNDRGQLIGIAAFILRDGQGLSFALPIDYAIRRFEALTDDTVRDERVASFETWLGRQVAAEHTAGVGGVAKGSPAADRAP